MFWTVFIELCNKNNKKPNAVAKDLKISSGAVTKWKTGSKPNDTTLLKIADYFGVTVEYLKGENKDLPMNKGLREYIVFHRNGKNLKVKLTPEQQKIFDALVSSSNVEEMED